VFKKIKAIIEANKTSAIISLIATIFIILLLSILITSCANDISRSKIMDNQIDIINGPSPDENVIEAKVCDLP
jgi:hypothetical protein